MPAFQAHLPFVQPLLDAMVRPECNCFFLTFLGARPDGQRYHTDNYFENFCGGSRASDLVTVAYLEADEAMVGGELVVLKVSASEVGPIRHGCEAPEQVLQVVRPSPGMVVDFDGQLLHGVRAFQGPTQRVSAVLEQCRLQHQIARKTPRFSVFCQRSNEELILA
ncbi:unnamed protein product [Symbiodinium natans]|uniref:Fe2OG dioxygenase domain-containing protein n=1 Tax=Symbiodinium natans TaxID=878477 RepID=A0A812JXF8_9DINO|nr:unnamed protein product [Symbiodinium natans]